jgi:hypothetical protein
MRRMNVVLATLVLGGAVAGLALAGDPPKRELLGPLGHANCDGTPASGSPGDWGFVVFSSPGNGTVSASVSLKNAVPNSDYAVFLIQPGDCYKGIDGIITTNAEGNGSLRVSVPSVGTWAVVGVFGEGSTNQEFVTEAYEY